MVQLLNLFVLANVPNIKFVFVAPRCQIVIQFVIFETTNFLSVFAEFENELFFAQVPVHDVFVARPTKVAVFILIFYGSYSCSVKFILAYDLLSVKVNNPSFSAHTAYNHLFAFIQKF